MHIRIIHLCYDRNFTSPHTVRVEAGLAETMEQFDRNFKVRKLMGELLGLDARQSSKSFGSGVGSGGGNGRASSFLMSPDALGGAGGGGGGGAAAGNFMSNLASAWTNSRKHNGTSAMVR